MSSVLFYQLVMCAAILAFNLYSLESNGISTDLEVFSAIYEILMSTLPTFAYCYLSNKVTTRLLEVGDVFYGCVWYDLGVDQQKLFVSIIQRAQLDICFDGFGIIQCTLQSFSSVHFFLLEFVCV